MLLKCNFYNSLQIENNLGFKKWFDQYSKHNLLCEY